MMGDNKYSNIMGEYLGCYTPDLDLFIGREKIKKIYDDFPI